MTNSVQLGPNLNVTVLRSDTTSNTTADDLRADIQRAVDALLISNGYTIGFDHQTSASNISTGAILAGGSSVTAANAYWTLSSGIPSFDVTFTVTIPISVSENAVGNGTLTRAAVQAASTTAALAAALQASITNAILDARVTGIGVTVAIAGGKFQITATGSGQITIDFTSPLQVATGGGKVSLNASGAKYSTVDAGGKATPSIDVQPRVDISLDYVDSAFQGLGMTSTPTRFDYSSGEKDTIAFTLFVNSKALTISDAVTTYTTVAQLVTQLNADLDAQLTAAFGNVDQNADGVHDVRFCRVNLDPNGDPCGGTGSRLVIVVDPAVVHELSIFVPETVGGSPNGAITELGFAAGQGEDKKAHATQFFFQDVKLQGSFQFVVQNVTATASLGFLSITATGSGTLKPDGTTGGQDLIALTGTLELRNPVAQPITVHVTTVGDGSTAAVQEITLHALAEGSPTDTATFTISDGAHSVTVPWNVSAADLQTALQGHSIMVTVSSLGVGHYQLTWMAPGQRDPLQAVGSDETRIDVDTIASAVGTGQIFYNGTLAGLSGSPRAPPTGFVKASISGGLGGSLTVAPDGFLAGVSDALQLDPVHLGVTATATNWLDGIPTPSFTFSGPNFDNILAQFRNLNFATVIAGLQAVVSYIQSFASSGGVLGDILNTQLPLVGKSINDLLDIANKIADTVKQIVQNPAGAIQQLNNIIASALGQTIPTLPIATTTPGGGSDEVQSITVTNTQHGTFTLQFKGATTTPLDFHATAAQVQTALENLATIGPGNVHVTGGSGTYSVEFQGDLGNLDVPSLSGDATKLTNTDLLSFNDGEIDFNLALAFSATFTQAFNLNLQTLADLTHNSFLQTIASIASSFVGVGGSGSLALTAQGELDLKLGLQFQTPAAVTTITAGNSTTNEIQKLHVNFSSGQYTLQYDANGNGSIDSGESATPLDWDSTASDIETALGTIAGLAGNVHVTGSGHDFQIEFTSGLAHTDIVEVSVATSGAFFIKTGNSGTGFTASASAAVNDLNFQAKIGPFGLFVKNGHAAIGASIGAHLVDADGDGQFVILGFGPNGLVTDFDHIGSFFTTGSVTLDGTAPGCATHDIACASLPIFVGTTNTQVPIDFLTGDPGSHNTLGLDFAFTGDFATLISNPANAFSISTVLPNWDDFHFDAPSLLALLADPSNIVDGLDTVLSTIQDLLSGQIFGVSLPLVGDFLKDPANNPLVKTLSDFRTQWLQPLAQLIRENNLDLDSLVQLIEDQVIGVLGSVTAGGLLPDGSHSIGGGHFGSDDILFRLLNEDGSVGNIFTANAAQFDFTLGHDWSFTADPIELNLGIPALGIQARFTPQINIHLGLHLGFGVSLNDGFYLVTKAPGPVDTPELSLSVAVNFFERLVSGRVRRRVERHRPAAVPRAEAA